MAGRGSGIGMGLSGGLGVGGGGGSSTSRRSAAPGQVYGPSVKGRGLSVHHYLWLLVAIEIGALALLRYLFRHHHGG
jgi:hypothetical protein